MKSLTIYDRALCCSTGVCGPQVDPVLPRFAADVEWLQSQGVKVERHNLAQNPAEFVSNETVRAILNSEGVECLPLIFVDGVEVSRRDYPSREQLAQWTNTKTLDKQNRLPISVSLGRCCGSQDCC